MDRWFLTGSFEEVALANGMFATPSAVMSLFFVASPMLQTSQVLLGNCPSGGDAVLHNVPQSV